MSEMIDNSEKRKQELREIIRSLNENGDNDKTKKMINKRFAELLKTLSPEEIADAEQSLISEGMKVEEVQKLCEVHVNAFESTLKKNAKKDQTMIRLSKMPGHPVATYRAENDALRKELKKFLRILKKSRNGLLSASVREAFESVALVEIHFARKENQLFPYLESAGFSGPSKVMWGKHNEIRTLLRAFRQALNEEDLAFCRENGPEISRALTRMMFMEEKILFPNALRKLPEAIWIAVRRGESAIGYAWVKPGNLWDPNVASARGTASEPVRTDYPAIPLSTGSMTTEQLNLMLVNLPVDISYVDEKDIVRYYSDNAARIFPRSPGVIGREVQNCHPQTSVHVVQKIIDDFKSRKRSEAEFWIQMRGKFIHIRYVALFAGDSFKGILEITQDVTAIRALEGEKRLLDDA